MAATDVTPHLWWIVSRASGSAALVLSSVAVGFGLVLGGRLVKGRGPDLRVLHEALSLATLVALAIHAGALLGDGFLNLGVVDVSIPFASSYQRLWTATGIVAGWALLILGLSYYARARIGAERWKRLHRLTALAWILGIGHSLGEGTDAGQTWFLALSAVAVLPPFVLLVVRHLRSGFSQRPLMEN